ncbi:MAG: cation:proton antiporter [Candidatus Eisenbacteria bacterium]
MRLSPRTLVLAALPLLVALPMQAQAATGAGGDTLVAVLEALVLVLVAARLGGALFARFGQPAVLGELLAGIVLGNLPVPGLEFLHEPATRGALDLFAQIGVLFLLFHVGLESDVSRMLAVGRSALLVALLGVAAPFALGYGVSAWLHPQAEPLMHLFVGATLTATSVGLTARVLGDMGRATSVEGRIILGAAVLDDVLGLVVLAVVTGLIRASESGGAFAPADVAWILGKALLFLAGALVVGRWLSRAAFRMASRLQGEGLLLTVALAFCFGLSWLAARAGLAPIVGAFAAGLVLDEVHYADLAARERHAKRIEDLLHPLAGFLVPVFFVLMGLGVKLSAFVAPGVPVFALVLTLAAVAGKQLCALGVLEKGADRIAVGLGMIPRGEVGLIFAGIGAALTLHGERVVDDATFSAIVVMVALTTMLTPGLLGARLRRGAAKPPAKR